MASSWSFQGHSDPECSVDPVLVLVGPCSDEGVNSLTLSLFVCVSLAPSGLACVVKPEGVPQLCQTDEIGELCVCSIATGTSYYGLTGMTKNTFEVCVYMIVGVLVFNVNTKMMKCNQWCTFAQVLYS